MVYEDYYYSESSDYMTCDYMDCGEAECFDLVGEITCMCVDTLTPPNDGLCQQPEIHEIGSGEDFSDLGVISFTPGINIINHVTQEVPVPVPQQPEDVILSSTVYLISGLCALVLLSVGLFVIFYVSFCKRRSSRNLDVESESAASSRFVSASQSPLLIHSVQPTKMCPFLGTNSTLSAVQPSLRTESVGAFGTFDRRSK